MVAKGDLQFWVRRVDPFNRPVNTSIRVPASELPRGEFLVEVLYTAETARISIDGETRVEGASIGLLETLPQEGLSVGFDSGTQSVGPVAPPHPFNGVIREVRLALED